MVAGWLLAPGSVAGQAWTAPREPGAAADSGRTGAAGAVADSGRSGTAGAVEDTLSDADLAATTAVPWHPERPVPSEQPWETAVRLPGRIVGLPLSLLGSVARSTARAVEQGNVIVRLQGLLAGVTQPPFGLAVGAPDLGPGTGFGLALGITPTFLGGMFTAELSGSTRNYTRTRLAVTRGPATVHYAYDWRPRDRYFGLGMRAADDSMSTYAWRRQRVQLTLVYPWRPAGPTPPRLQLRGWVGPRELVLRHGRHAPSFEQIFPAETAMLNARQEHLVYGLGVSADTRSGRPHWTRGVSGDLRLERFDRSVDWLTLRSARTDAPQFTRLSAQGQAGVSFGRDPRTLRLRLRGVRTSSISANAPLLLPDLASLGADDGLACYDLGRFHDHDVVYGTLAYIFPLTTYIEMEAHAESGGAYPRVAAVRAASFRNSFGLALRARSETRLLASIGVDWNAEALAIRFDLRGGE